VWPITTKCSKLQSLLFISRPLTLPDKEDLHIPIQGDNKPLIIINIEAHFSMSTALVSGIFSNDLSRCPLLLLLLFTDISQELCSGSFQLFFGSRSLWMFAKLIIHGSPHDRQP
jgi:hypothetical protein